MATTILRVVWLLILVSSLYSEAVYRSKEGCCVCGTKSQKSKAFLSSSSYQTYFKNVLGISARTGGICCACIRVINKWKQKSGDRSGAEKKTQVRIAFKISISTDNGSVTVREWLLNSPVILFNSSCCLTSPVPTLWTKRSLILEHILSFTYIVIHLPSFGHMIDSYVGHLASMELSHQRLFSPCLIETLDWNWKALASILKCLFKGT